MRFGVLGSVEARVDDVLVSLGGPQQRRLLALLLSTPGRSISVDRLVECLWSDGLAPDGAPRAVMTYVSRLRAALHESSIATVPGGYQLELDGSQLDSQQFEELLSAEGVDYACILAELSPVTTGICNNEQVQAFCKGRKRLIPFCDINPHLFTDLGSELRRKVEVEGFRGLKLYPTYQHYYLNDRRIYPLYQAAQDLKIPVLIHTGSSVFKGSRIKYGDPLHLDDVANDFPSLNLVMAHSGRGFWYDRAFFLSRLHANLYMELSGLPPAKLLSYFPDLARNTDKVIFGSDWPGMIRIKQNMDAISDLHHGGSPMSDRIARKVVQAFQELHRSSKETENLTERESEILSFVAKGYQDKEIAEKLFLSSETVRTHLRNIYKKLHVRSRTEATLKYLH